MLSVGRGYAAADLLGHDIIRKRPHDGLLVYRVLRAFVDQKITDVPTSMTGYSLQGLLKDMQSNPEIKAAGKAEVEWCFVDLADWIGGGFRPSVLEAEFARDPKLFCEAITIAYLSGKESRQRKRMKVIRKQDANPAEMRRRENVWKILFHWSAVPGVDSAGKFDAKVFRTWVRQAFALAKKADRLVPAKITLAKALINAPADADGFWMPHEIAKMLENDGSGVMLRNYAMAWFNSRGVHTVDSKEDEKLAAKYDGMASAAEKVGHFGLARAMQSVADDIRDESKREQDNNRALDAYFEAKHEELESYVGGEDD